MSKKKKIKFGYKNPLLTNVCTHNAGYYPDEVAGGEKKEYGKPKVPVSVFKEVGLRIVLGSHGAGNKDGLNEPDVMIERQPTGWMIFVHPDGGDPSAVIFVQDAKANEEAVTYLLKDRYPDNLVTVEADDPFPNRPSKKELTDGEIETPSPDPIPAGTGEPGPEGQE